MLPAILKRTVLMWLVVLSACTIQLVPSYDQALVEGLDQANKETLTLFAAVESGSPKEKFSDYEDRYATLIGTFDALRERAASRQVPPLAARLSKMKFVQGFCNSDSNPASCVNVSPLSHAQVLKDLRQMRDTHRSSGLEPSTVVSFRNDYETAVGQALTVENALKR